MVGFSFRSCDKYGLGVITPHEFRSGIEKRLGYPMSERQWDQVKCDVGQDSDVICAGQPHGHPHVKLHGLQNILTTCYSVLNFC